MDKEKKEHLALSLGFILILFVIIITLFRADMAQKDKNKDDTDSTIPQSAQKNSSSIDYQTISVKDLEKKIILSSQNQNLTLLDIRPFDSYIKEHILDAQNYALDEFPVEQKIDTKKPLVVIGQNNDDADIAKAVTELKKENFNNVVVLAGGMDSWKQFDGKTITYGDPTSFVDQTKVSYVDPANLHDALTQKVPVYIVDVRSADAYTKGHIEGAVNVPFDDLEKNRNKITEKKVVVVGDNELQEFQAGVQMYDMLLVSPYVMRTAMSGWQQQGFPVVQ